MKFDPMVPIKAHMLKIAIAWMALTFPLFSHAQQMGGPLAAKPITVKNCLTQPRDIVNVPSPVAGILDKTLIEEGDLVQADQELAIVDDRLAALEVQKKAQEFNNTYAFKIADKTIDEYKAQHDANLRLKGNISLEELRLSQVRWELKILERGDLDEKQAMLKTDLDMAEETLERHHIRSPLTGRVELRARRAGEAVEANQPFIRIVNSEVMKIEGYIEASEARRVAPDLTVEVFPEVIVGPERILHGHTAEIHAVCNVPDNTGRCVSADEYGNIFVWDIVNELLTANLRGHRNGVYALAIHPNQPQLLASGGEDGMIRLWDLNASKLVKEIPTAIDAPIHALAFHPQDPSKLFANQERTIRVWDLNGGTQLMTYDGLTNHTSNITISPDGKYLFGVPIDSTFLIWEMGKNAPWKTLQGRSSGVRLGISPQGDRYLFNSSDVLQVRQLETDLPVTNITPDSNLIHSVAEFTPTGDFILIGGDKNRLELWQTAKKDRPARVVRYYQGHTQDVHAIAFSQFSNQGGFFISGGKDRIVRVWNVPTNVQAEKEVRKSQIKFLAKSTDEISINHFRFTVEVENKDNLFTAGVNATVVIYPKTSVSQK